LGYSRMELNQISVAPGLLKFSQVIIFYE
jgi:hypothetical protein